MLAFYYGLGGRAMDGGLVAAFLIEILILIVCMHTTTISAAGAWGQYPRSQVSPVTEGHSLLSGKPCSRNLIEDSMRFRARRKNDCDLGFDLKSPACDFHATKINSEVG